jgi:hypothetical protein
MNLAAAGGWNPRLLSGGGFPLLFSFVFCSCFFQNKSAFWDFPPLLQRRESMPDTLFTFFDALSFTWPPSYGTIFQIGAVVYFLGWLLIQWDNARPMRGSAQQETASAHGTARWHGGEMLLKPD